MSDAAEDPEASRPQLLVALGAASSSSLTICDVPGPSVDLQCAKPNID